MLKMSRKLSVYFTFQKFCGTIYAEGVLNGRKNYNVVRHVPLRFAILPYRGLFEKEKGTYVVLLGDRGRCKEDHRRKKI